MNDENDNAGDWTLMMMMMMRVVAKCRDDVKRDSSDYLPAAEQAWNLQARVMSAVCRNYRPTQLFAQPASNIRLFSAGKIKENFFF